MSDEFVLLKTFQQPHEAYIIMSRLEEEGIPVIIADENAIWASPFYSLAIGGVRMMVRQEDFPAAVELLKLIEEGLFLNDEE